MDLKEKLNEYAKLIAYKGVNVTSGKYVIISCPVFAADFGCQVAEYCYKAGAVDVIMNYYDEKFSKVRYTYASEETIGDIPFWQAERRNMYARLGCCNISIIADDPEIFTGVDSNKLMKASVASKKAFKEFYDIMDKGGVRWTVVAYPNVKWAEKIFPDLHGSDAVDALWDKIFKTVRIADGDCVEKWREHDSVLKKRASKLNNANFDYLHYTNSLGTDLKVYLPENHIWYGGSEEDRDGVVYFPNMPTEEIFTMPHADKTQGVVYSAMPLVYQGGIIDKFKLVFKDGLVTEYSAETGQDILERILNTDEGSKRIGEAALIPFSSPISDMNILFYETLFDENASCHLALGECYPNTVKGGENMTEAELRALGGNRSVNHVDFMIGTADMNIDGVTKDGKTVPVFRNGNFAI